MAPLNTIAAWQRWTIDEISEGVVRVLAADARYPFESNTAQALDAHAEGPLRDAVAQLEALSPDDMWEEEEALHLPADELTEFLKRRDDAAGLPDARPLREGDVFWIVLPPRAEVGSPTGAVSDADLLAHLAALEADVLDVTAASRQAAKHVADAALRAEPRD